MSKTLRFKIKLLKSKPTIWRRFIVVDSMNFHELHLVIQNVMGWTNSHLYQFMDSDEMIISDPELMEEFDVTNSKKLKLSKFFNSPGTILMYEYDFGDGWDHELTLEKIITDGPKLLYPVCLDGAMNCPPEDCGGIHGFYEYLKAMKDVKHPEHEDIVEWMGDYDADAFNLEKINNRLNTYSDIELSME